MKHKKRRLIVWLCLSALAAFAVCAGNWLWHETHTRTPNTQNTCNFGDIGGLAGEFMNRNRRWPETLEELELPERLCQDARSGAPHRWVANDRLYAKSADDGLTEEHRVLMTLSHTFRSEPWPFGRVETLVLLDDLSVAYLPPSKIHQREEVAEGQGVQR